MPDTDLDWADYCKLAKELANREEEACLRSSLSRACYYTFHIARIRAKRNGFAPVKNESTHNRLWRLYSKSPESECILLGQMALRLKEKRERADYERIYKRIDEEAPEVLRDVQDFARLARLRARHPSPLSVREKEPVAGGPQSHSPTSPSRNPLIPHHLLNPPPTPSPSPVLHVG
jgi:uncharacterized protein (UPF0332 family)